jgi:hypothetical protein
VNSDIIIVEDSRDFIACMFEIRWIRDQWCQIVPMMPTIMLIDLYSECSYHLVHYMGKGQKPSRTKVLPFKNDKEDKSPPMKMTGWTKSLLWKLQGGQKPSHVHDRADIPPWQKYICMLNTCCCFFSMHSTYYNWPNFVYMNTVMLYSGTFQTGIWIIKC